MTIIGRRRVGKTYLQLKSFKQRLAEAGDKADCFRDAILELQQKQGGEKMGKKKVEHVVFDGMRKIKKKVNISKYNQNTQKKLLRKENMEERA